MRERKCVKFRVDMYDDTKFKIIDRKSERDLIHYVWTRFVILAGKVNLEGNLFMSKNIPYTVETLSIEFNRDADQIKLALDVLIELEMIEVIEHNIYKVKNFAKHQNIKVKEKIIVNGEEDSIKNKEVKVKESVKNASQIDKEKENAINQNKSNNLINENASNVELNQKIDPEINYETDFNINNVQGNSISKDDIPILLDTKKNKKQRKKKELGHIFEMNDEESNCDEIDGIQYEERPLGKDEHIISQWFFE